MSSLSNFGLLLVLITSISACTQESVTLPHFDSSRASIIRIDQNYPVELIKTVKNAAEIRQILDFLNVYEDGWTVPWTGPPVGTVYLKIYQDEQFLGNFYVGANFFGRDGEDFYSQKVSRDEIDRLGYLLGVDLSERIDN